MSVYFRILGPTKDNLITSTGYAIIWSSGGCGSIIHHWLQYFINDRVRYMQQNLTPMEPHWHLNISYVSISLIHYFWSFVHFLLDLWNVYGDCENYSVMKGHQGAIMDLQYSMDGTWVRDYVIIRGHINWYYIYIIILYICSDLIYVTSECYLQLLLTKLVTSYFLC